MAFSNEGMEVLMDLDTHDTNRFVLEPAINYENIIQNMLGVYKIEEGVQNKLKLTHLRKPKNSLQPGGNCKSWNPTVKFGTKVREVTVCDFEVNGEQCPDEWDRGCARNLQALGNARTDITASPELNAILESQIMLLRDGLNDDIYKVGWFGDPDFNTASYGYEIDLSGYSPKEIENLERQQRQCKGWWWDIVTLVEDGRMKFVNSNDGSVDGNAINPSNVLGFLEQLVLSSSLELRYWNRGRPAMDWPVMMVQSGIYRAYMKYLQSLGEVEAHRLIVEGSRVPGVLTYENYLVVEIPEWTMWDTEVGSLQTSGDYAGFSKYQRALFTAQENLTMATDTVPFRGTNSSIIVQQSTHIKDKGIMWILMMFRFGFMVAEPKLATAAYNSEVSYINS